MAARSSIGKIAFQAATGIEIDLMMAMQANLLLYCCF